jgi:hypothetical protein
LPTNGGGRRIPVRFHERVWREAIRGFSGRAIDIATSARRDIEENKVELATLRPCEPLGPDRTELGGCAKLYLPRGDAPPSERPFAFVFQLARTRGGAPVLVFLAFGPRHPRPGVRSVYERAHRQLHGRFPG